MMPTLSSIVTNDDKNWHHDNFDLSVPWRHIIHINAKRWPHNENIRYTCIWWLIWVSGIGSWWLSPRSPKGVLIVVFRCVGHNWSIILGQCRPSPSKCEGSSCTEIVPWGDIYYPRINSKSPHFWCFIHREHIVIVAALSGPWSSWTHHDWSMSVWACQGFVQCGHQWI